MDVRNEIAKAYGLSVVEVSEKMVLHYKLLRKIENNETQLGSSPKLCATLKNEIRELVEGAKEKRKQ